MQTQNWMDAVVTGPTTRKNVSLKF